jgi:predicted nuclease with TOPRIM domain
MTILPKITKAELTLIEEQIKKLEDELDFLRDRIKEIEEELGY